MIRKIKSYFEHKRSYNRLKSLDIGPEDVVLDCGANIGKVTELLAQTGAQVHAFEPNPYAFKKLQDRTSRYSNVTCHNKAVLDEDATLKLFLHENSDADPVRWSTGSSLLDSKNNIKKEKSIEVEVVDLTRFILELKRKVKFVKIDVEGVEYKIIKKIVEKDVLSAVDHIFVETHEDKNPNLLNESREVRELLKKKGIDKIRFDWV